MQPDSKAKRKAEGKLKQKTDKKLNKKIAKAINVILHHEHKKAEDIFSETPTKYLWCYHFGNGDEEDQVKIKKFYEENYGTGVNVIIYPGISYGFIELASLEIAENLIKKEKGIKIKNEEDFCNAAENLEDIKNENLKKFIQKKAEGDIESLPTEKIKQLKINTFCHNINFTIGGDRLVFSVFSKIASDQVEQDKTCNFPNAHYFVDIPGLYIFEDFISESEEKELIETVDQHKWDKLTNRRVQHYGYEFIYGANIVNKHNKIGEIPDFCTFLMQRFQEKLGKFKVKKNIDQIDLKAIEADKAAEYFNYIYDEKEAINDKVNYETFHEKFGNFDQLTINDYNPGDGIPPHCDSHSPFEDVFCSLSLGSGAVMSFFHNNETLHYYMKPRSIAFFSGEVRFFWEHSIALRKVDRVDNDLFFRRRRLSLTFRKIRKTECVCPYVGFCDSQKKKITAVSPVSDYNINIADKTQIGVSKVSKNNDPIALQDSLNLLNSDSTLPTDIEKKHVYDVYEKIAPHFSHTRYKPWPKVQEFLEGIPAGSLNADIGCGNGKYLNVNDKTVYNVGTDRCFNLLQICREKNDKNQVFAADSLKLPFRSSVFDTAISIAVVHHFSNVPLRLRAIAEIIRILAVGGKFLIYVWALEQEKKFEQQDNFVPWHLQNNYENENVQVTSLGPQIVKEEKKNSTVYHRYYHMFKKDELEQLLKQFENIEILDSYYEHANWCCIVRKTKD